LSLLFMMKVMVWHFVGNSHKVMTALIVALPSNYCCWDLFLQFYRYCTLIEISNYKQSCQPLLKSNLNDCLTCRSLVWRYMSPNLITDQDVMMLWVIISVAM
jgi:hypothetical protein